MDHTTKCILIKYAKEADFGIILDKTESQKIKILEIIAVGCLSFMRI